MLNISHKEKPVLIRQLYIFEVKYEKRKGKKNKSVSLLNVCTDTTMK